MQVIRLLPFVAVRCYEEQAVNSQFQSEFVGVYVHVVKGARWLSQKESVQFNEPAPLWRLTRGLGLTSHPKDGMANSEISFMSLYVTV